MDRRNLIKGMLLGSAAMLGSPSMVLAAPGRFSNGREHPEVKDYLNKIKNYNTRFADDIVLTGNDYALLKSTTARLKRVQRLVGYANFALIDFDRALLMARRYSRVGAFPKAEIDFIESIFYRNAKDYGFYGEKVMTEITARISTRDTKKIPHTGNYLYRGDAEKLYNKIRKDLGHRVTLTSGVRGVVKQMYLFLNKAVRSEGNLSMASRSLAPPGHSFHGTGDFDVGKVGFGYRNFTEDFAKTDEFKRLKELGYIRIRYHELNPFGVRFEPWHIKVVS